MISLILIVTLILSFIFVVLVPTLLFLKDKKNKKIKYESIVLFLFSSLLYLLLTYLCVNFYLLKAVDEVVECTTLANMNCLMYDLLDKAIKPELSIYMVLFVQLIIMGTYAYYTAICIMNYGSKLRVITTTIMYFLVSIVASIIHYYTLYDCAFVSGLKYITLFSANAYIVLPFIYLMIMTYLNRRQLKIK